MPATTPEREVILPGNGKDRDAVLGQMERILASPHFRHSRRYPVLFRYVVEKTLQGLGDTLKERTVGVDAFQREPDYDTNLDPIVRVTAGEVRKRIAQYYHEDGREDELRIDLPPGSYVPVFHFSADAVPPEPVARPAVAIPDLPPPTPAFVLPSIQPRASFGRRPIALGIAALLVLSIATAWFFKTRNPSTLDSVWRSILGTTGPVVISIGEPSLSPPPPPIGSAPLDPSAELTVSDHLRKVDYLAFSDVQAMTRLTSLLDRKQHTYRLQPASATTFADLREGASILIGGFDNPWTLRAIQTMPFGFGRNDQALCWIVDRRDPSSRRWSVDFRQPYAQLTDDYAIVARIIAPDTQQPMLIVAGVGENGTKAAAEFITDPEALRAALGSRETSGKNIEIVLGTQVIKGVSGPPRILAQQTW